MAGIQEELADKLDNLQFHVEYLDITRYKNSEHSSFLSDSALHYKLEGNSFDLILLSDNEALTFTLEHRDDFFAKTPIVFCGVNNFKPDMISGDQGITGVIEAPAYRETIELALRLHPGTEEIIFVGNNQTTSNQDKQNLQQTVLSEFRDQVKFKFWDDLPLSELTVRLRRLGRGSLIFINGLVTDQSGHIHSLTQSIKLLKKDCAVPIYSLWDSPLGQGIVGGKLVNATLQGRLAGQLALKILQGVKPEDLAVIKTGTNQYMFDYRELKRFGVPLKALPEDSVIINRPRSIYSLSKSQLWVVFGIMTFFAGALLVNLIGRRKAERALVAREAQVNLLLNSAAEGIYGLDLEGKCTFCNRATLQLLGYDNEQALLGKRMHALTHHTRTNGSHYPEEECRICQAFYEDEGFHYEDEVFWKADGSSFPVEYWAYPLRKDNKPIGAVVSFMNITERKLAETHLIEANRELDAFVYTVSHDLRTPLSAIIGFTALLIDEKMCDQDENVQEILTVIEKQGARMAALIEDLLALATIGTLERPKKPVDVEVVIDGVLLELGGPLASAGLTVQRNPMPDIRVPETLLTEIFANLLGNAVRYVGKNGNPIEVGGEQRNTMVRLYVRDHGPGVLVEERSRIFDVFYRGAMGEMVSGTGVGLATVQKIARLFGGRAWVEETPGGGATFWVEMENPPVP